MYSHLFFLLQLLSPPFLHVLVLSDRILLQHDPQTASQALSIPHTADHFHQHTILCNKIQVFCYSVQLVKS